ncbi:hypothetical protein XELAEV_18028734mg [Xenopus laevis]|uniref:Uncharacterized protein n=1 Tax=Xenopus laevis TaxID=8355 RepID=A0A974HGX9_XENLA|nr:hypothetical protein XELAEV_18028734mg [Xenopus laevis]
MLQSGTNHLLFVFCLQQKYPLVSVTIGLDNSRKVALLSCCGSKDMEFPTKRRGYRRQTRNMFWCIYKLGTEIRTRQVTCAELLFRLFPLFSIPYSTCVTTLINSLSNQ